MSINQVSFLYPNDQNSKGKRHMISDRGRKERILRRKRKNSEKVEGLCQRTVHRRKSNRLLNGLVQQLRGPTMLRNTQQNNNGYDYNIPRNRRGLDTPPQKRIQKPIKRPRKEKRIHLSSLSRPLNQDFRNYDTMGQKIQNIKSKTLEEKQYPPALHPPHSLRPQLALCMLLWPPRM